MALIFNPPVRKIIGHVLFPDDHEKAKSIDEALNEITDHQYNHQFRTGFSKDLVDDAQTRIGTAETALTSHSTSITSLGQSVEELEELIVMLQKRLRSLINTIDADLKCLTEQIEMN